MFEDALDADGDFPAPLLTAEEFAEEADMLESLYTWV